MFENSGFVCVLFPYVLSNTASKDLHLIRFVFLITCPLEFVVKS